MHLLILSDSLAFHGPEHAELTTDPRLWPQVLAAELTRRAAEPDACTAVIYGRQGWTARDAWFALTRDPHVYSVLLPAADVVILAVGGMDYLPAVLPAHLRDGIRLLRPAPLRRLATGTFRRLQPAGARALRGRWRTLPQRVTDDYLTRCVQGIRHFHPRTRVLATVPPPHRAPSYGLVGAGHPGAVAAALDWGRRNGVPMLRTDLCVAGYLGRPGMNPDGLHWGWECHRAVARHAARLIEHLEPL